MNEVILAASSLTVFDAPTDRDEATQISVSELQTLLLEQKGATPLTFVAITEPKLTKKDRETSEPLGFVGVRKVNRVNGMVNFHYDEGVLRRLEKENKSADDFKKGTSWHTPILTADGKITPLCQHSKDATKVYVRFMLGRSLENEYRDSQGELIDADALKGFLPKSKPYQNQGLDSPLKFLVYGIDTIREISIDGHKYQIR